MAWKHALLLATSILIIGCGSDAPEAIGDPEPALQADRLTDTAPSPPLAFTIKLLTDTRKPNIVFILADDVGWGDVAAYGHPYALTPSIDSLAAEGTLFHRFYVTGAVCAPSRAGFMTSRSQATYSEPTEKAGFRERMTITGLLKDNGYATGHFGKWVIGPVQEPGTYGIDAIAEGIRPAETDTPTRDGDVFAAAIAFIEDNKDVPFYVNVWTRTAHFPTRGNRFVAPLFKDIEVKREDFSRYMQVKFDLTEDAGRDPKDGMTAYLSEIYALDLMIGNLLQRLDDLGLRQNTIVVFSSDQGPQPISTRRLNEGEVRLFNTMGYAGGFRGGKHTYYEGGVRTPFIIRWPGHVPAGRINTRSITSALDWLPTLAAVAGIPYDDEMFEGEDVSDIWKGSERSRRNPLFWGTGGRRAPVSMLQGNWKMHRSDKGDFLYDVADNPEEDRNLMQEHPAVAAGLGKKLDEWKESYRNKDESRAVVILPADIPEGF